LSKVSMLNILVEYGYDIAAVVTVPDRKKGRGLNIEYSDIKNAALKHGIKILQPDNLKDEKFISEIRTLNPDLIIVVAFRILPPELFTIPKHGSFNLHASLLPAYRGAAPINHAIMNGEYETGVTTFFLKEKVDTGNIILQEKIRIEDSDNAGTLHDKLALIGASTVLKTVKLVEAGKVELMVQDEKAASKAPKIFKEETFINWSKEASGIHNFIRALSPYPGAVTSMDGKTFKIFKSKVSELGSSGIPGQAIIKEGKLFVNANDKVIEILEIQPENKKKMGVTDFINGLSADKKADGGLTFTTIQED